MSGNGRQDSYDYSENPKTSREVAEIETPLSQTNAEQSSQNSLPMPSDE